jgi:hypothetical protein
MEQHSVSTSLPACLSACMPAGRYCRYTYIDIHENAHNAMENGILII